MLFGAVGIHEIEKQAQPEQFDSLQNCIWWTVVTLMTVGYGDMYPITTMGRVFAEVLMVIGVGLTAAFIGIANDADSVAFFDNSAEQANSSFVDEVNASFQLENNWVKLDFDNANWAAAVYFDGTN